MLKLTDCGLWPHQYEAVRDLAAVIGRGGRTTLVSPCGTGKARTGAGLSVELGETSQRVLVVVPTIVLMTQAIQEYVSVDATLPQQGVVIAVCSDASVAQRTTLASDDRLLVSTNAAEVASAVFGHTRVTIFCTYASLGVLSAAHALHNLPEWDFVVADEAHRTAGSIGGRWARIHHDAHIPSARRLYMTATPRITLSSEHSDVVSMDDTKIYGSVGHRLTFAQAIARKLIADYRVVVACVTNHDVRKLTDTPGMGIAWGGLTLHPREIASQISLVRAMCDYGFRRAITFHSRVREAARWAHTLPATAANIREGIELWAAYVSGRQSPNHRRAILNHLATSHSQGAVVASSQVLKEGVDVPDVDGVLLANARASALSTVQRIGRALRTGGNPDKIATIVLPVLLADNQADATWLDHTEWRHVWRALRALGDHDERFGDRLRHGRTQLAASAEAAAPSAYRTRLPESLCIQGEFPSAVTDEIALRAILSVPASSPRDAETDWDRTYNLVREWVQDGGNLATAAADVTLPDGTVIAGWAATQRAHGRKGMLSARQIRMLNSISFPWNVHRARWLIRFRKIEQIFDHHGSLEMIGRESPEGHWLRTQQAQYRAQRLDDDQVKLLRSVGVQLIDPSRPPTFDEMADELRKFKQKWGHLRVPRGYRTDAGHNLFVWQVDQRSEKRAGTLRPECEAILETIGIYWEPHKNANIKRCEELQEFYRTHGHLNGPMKDSRFYWLQRQRERHSDNDVPEYLATMLHNIHPQWFDPRACTNSPQVLKFFTVTNQAWKNIEPIVSQMTIGNKSSWHTLDRRRLIDGLIWKHRTGAPWVDFEYCFPVTGHVACRLWKELKRQGLWDKIMPHVELRGEVRARRAQSAGSP